VLSAIVIDPVVDKQGVIFADLRSCKPDAWRDLHRGKHILDELLDVVIDSRNRGAGTVQNGISRDDDIPNSHCSSLISVA
jgi:hypothetical protein